MFPAPSRVPTEAGLFVWGARESVTRNALFCWAKAREIGQELSAVDRSDTAQARDASRVKTGRGLLILLVSDPREQLDYRFEHIHQRLCDRCEVFRDVFHPVGRRFDWSVDSD